MTPAEEEVKMTLVLVERGHTLNSQYGDETVRGGARCALNAYGWRSRRSASMISTVAWPLNNSSCKAQLPSAER